MRPRRQALDAAADRHHCHRARGAEMDRQARPRPRCAIPEDHPVPAPARGHQFRAARSSAFAAPELDCLLECSVGQRTYLAIDRMGGGVNHSTFCRSGCQGSGNRVAIISWAVPPCCGSSVIEQPTNETLSCSSRAGSGARPALVCARYYLSLLPRVILSNRGLRVNIVPRLALPTQTFASPCQPGSSMLAPSLQIFDRG